MHQSVSMGGSSRRSSRFTWLLCAGWALAGSGCALPEEEAPEEASTIDEDTNALAAGASSVNASWTSVLPMKVSRRRHAAARLADGKVLLVGGLQYFSQVSSAEIFDPGARTWTLVAPTFYPILDGTSTTLPDGRVLVTGTSGPPGVIEAEVYQPLTNTWVSVPAPGPPRGQHAIAQLSDGRVLLTGGYAGYADAYLFDPATNGWSAAASMHYPRYQHRLTRLADGRVLATGGSTSLDGAPASAELFDPQTGTWTLTSSMALGRKDHVAVLLQSGKVLVTGGNSADPSAVEIFDPQTGTWAAAAPRSGLSATAEGVTLYDGKVLLALESSPTELYDPVADSWTVLATTSGAPGGTMTLLHCGEVLLVGGYQFKWSVSPYASVLSGLDDTSCATAGGAP